MRRQPDIVDFFHGWQQRSQMRRSKWQQDAAGQGQGGTELDRKIQRLRKEIADLSEQDALLFRQFFTLGDSIEQLKTQMQNDSGDSDFNEEDEDGLDSEVTTLPRPTLRRNRDSNSHTASFVRQRISFPPVSRNRHRCRRSQTLDRAGVETAPEPKTTPRRPHSMCTAPPTKPGALTASTSSLHYTEIFV